MNFKRLFRIAALPCAAFIMSGCASPPSLETMKAETAGYQLPVLPEPSDAMVYVVRPSSVGNLIRFNVFVDSKDPASEMGYTRAGQYIHFSLPPGAHKIYSKAEKLGRDGCPAQRGRHRLCAARAVHGGDHGAQQPRET